MNRDIRTLTAHQDEGSLGTGGSSREGHRTASWIYMTPRTTQDSAELHEWRVLVCRSCYLHDKLYVVESHSS